ncbi:hypothetical protein MKX96_18370 [Psychrobacillus sp. FSL W7-1493]|uniref:hypothetical protein n=1 Tax=Psychrobacillus sp. FSL W7-1493 TaxID=2921552 RepID=UPI0030FC71EB
MIVVNERLIVVIDSWEDSLVIDCSKKLVDCRKVERDCSKRAADCRNRWSGREFGH